MAYQPKNLTPEEQARLQQRGVNTSGVIEGASGGGGAAPGGSVAPAGSKAPGTGYVNLQQYLNTNAGQGAKLAEDTTKGLTSEADAYKSGLQGTVDQAKSGFSAATGDDAAAQINQQLKKDASAAQQDASNFLTKGYGGPTSGDYTANLAVGSKDLAQKLGSVDNADTQAAALKDTYGKQGGYSAGFGLLDRFLLQGDQSGRQKLDEVKAKAKDVTGGYDDAAAKINQAELDARNKLSQNQRSILDTAIGTKDEIISDADQRVRERNLTLDKSRDGAKEAGYGDVLEAERVADLQALDALINEQGDYSSRWNAGSDPIIPEVVPETTKASPAEAAGEVWETSTGTPVPGKETTKKRIGQLGDTIGAVMTAVNAPSNTGRAMIELAKDPSAENVGDVWDAMGGQNVRDHNAEMQRGYKRAADDHQEVLGQASENYKDFKDENAEKLPSWARGIAKDKNAFQDKVADEALSLPGNVLRELDNLQSDFSNKNIQKNLDNISSVPALRDQLGKLTAKGSLASANTSEAVGKAADDTKAAAQKAASDAKAAAQKASDNAAAAAKAAKQKADEAAAAAKKLAAPALKAVGSLLGGAKKQEKVMTVTKTAQGQRDGATVGKKGKNAK